jgi:hypothetical protein
MVFGEGYWFATCASSADAAIAIRSSSSHPASILTRALKARSVGAFTWRIWSRWRCDEFVGSEFRVEGWKERVVENGFEEADGAFSDENEQDDSIAYRTMMMTSSTPFRSLEMVPRKRLI